MSSANRIRLGLPVYPLGSQTASINSFLLNQTTDQVEVIFAADDPGAITKLGVRQTTLTGVAPVFRVSLQGVDASGNPDGSIKAAGSAFADYTPTAGNNNTFQWLTLGASYTAARGELLAFVIAYQSGTIDGSNNCSFGVSLNGTATTGFPYATQNDAGVRSRQGAPPLFGYATAARAYGSPIQTGATINVNSGSSPDEVGILFTVPAGWTGTYQVLGAVIQQTWPAAHVLRMTLYGTDGTTVLQQVDRDTDAAEAAGVRLAEVTFDEATLAILTAGSTYRLAFAPQDATSHQHSYFEAATASDWDAVAGGQSFSWTERTDAGAWTDRATRKIFAELILADVSGGGVRTGRHWSGGYSG
jgi:hypothetical protein